MVAPPQAGRHYPASTGDLLAWFPTDADCLDYLEWLQWPEGFVCPDCGHRGGWRLSDGRLRCAGCGSRTSVTAGTIFDRTRTPLTHRVASLTKRWLLGTHQGSIDEAHLSAYLDEFVFRFNRRRSRRPRMLFYRLLELAVGHEPVRYKDLIVNPQPKKNPPTAPGGRGHPPSLERPPADRPWRTR